MPEVQAPTVTVNLNQSDFTFDWSTILKLLLPALLPVLVGIFLPMIEQWLNIDLDEARITELITQIISILIPVTAGGLAGTYWVKRSYDLAQAKMEAEVRMAEVNSQATAA